MLVGVLILLLWGIIRESLCLSGTYIALNLVDLIISSYQALVQGYISGPQWIICTLAGVGLTVGLLYFKDLLKLRKEYTQQELQHQEYHYYCKPSYEP